MARHIVIVGGLPTQVSPESFLQRLRDRIGNDVDWQWICTPLPAHSLPQDQLGPFNRLLHRLRANKDSPRDLSSVEDSDRPEVIKLRCLRKREANQLESACDPILAPKGIVSEDELFEWIVSAESGLFPPREWKGNCREAALLALTEKLLRNHSIAGGTGGHDFTKEDDLLNQAPVSRARFPEIREEAKDLLYRLNKKLFWRKGTGQGNTPVEWAINTAFLPGLKRAVITCSIEPLEDYEELRPIVQRIRSDQQHPYRIDHEIIVNVR